MSKRAKLILLFGIIAVLACGVILQASYIYKNIHQSGLPVHKSRQAGEVQPQGWMTVVDLSRHFNIPEEDIFQAFQISPAPGDEKLSLRALRQKYHKTPSEMQTGLKQLGIPGEKKP